MFEDKNQINQFAIPVKDKAGSFSFIDAEFTIAEPVQVTETVKVKQVSLSVGQPLPVKNSAAALVVPNTDKPKARFYIDTEDEQEVAKMQVPERSREAYDFSQVSFAIVKSLKLDIDRNLQERLEKIVLSYLKGIRNQRQISEVFIREAALGGLGLSEPKAKKAIVAIETQKTKILSELKFKESDGILNKEYVPQGVLANQAEDIFASVPQVEPSENLQSDKLITEIQPRSKPIPGVPIRPVSMKQVPVTRKREKIQRVGPVEEIGLMSLENFRHLGSTAKESAQRIFQKIDLLADESLEIKADAIKAWHKSPVYRKYIEIGQKSMETGSSVEEIVGSNKENGLTIEEFEVVADLNKSLRF